MLGIKPLGQIGQYDSFPSTSLLLPFINDNELSICDKPPLLLLFILYRDTFSPSHMWISMQVKDPQDMNPVLNNENVLQQWFAHIDYGNLTARFI